MILRPCAAVVVRGVEPEHNGREGRAGTVGPTCLKILRRQRPLQARVGPQQVQGRTAAAVSQSVAHLRARAAAQHEVQGLRRREEREKCEHGRVRSVCKECGGGGICVRGL